jgi:phosphomannomutase
LAAFYPACRECPHRGDTATLSSRQIEQLQEVQATSEPRSLFRDEGVGGVYLNDLTPATARHIAAAFGMMMGGERLRAGDEGQAKEEAVASGQWSVASKSAIHHPPATSSSNPQSLIPNPSVILANDGRAITADIAAGACEGLRFGGCDVIDIGPATAACLAFAVRHFGAVGGILIGNSDGKPQFVSMQFWDAGPMPLSAGSSLERLAEQRQVGVRRSEGNAGTLRREAAHIPYITAMSRHYHALRPLRVAIDSASSPLVEYLQKLATATACAIIPSRSSRQLATAHFSVSVDSDGERCRVWDEKGRAASAERLFLLLAVSCSDHGATIVVEDATSPAIVERIKLAGYCVIAGGRLRAEMAAAMRQHDAVLGGGPSGRFWFADTGVPLPDALMAITQLLILLSRDDEPLSDVLDRDAAVK